MPKTKHGMPSQRQLRVGEQVRHALIEVIQRGKFHDEVLMDAADVTINEVRMSPDLKQAKAFVSALGQDEIDHYLAALNDSAAYFQKELNRKLEIKFTPRVTFVQDKTIEQAARLEEILHNLPKGQD